MGDMPLLHIFGQHSEHTEAWVLGNEAGLRALRAAIDEALAGGVPIAEVFASDGEGYDVMVVRENSDWQGEVWQAQRSPYTRPPWNKREQEQPDPGPWDLPEAKRIYAALRERLKSE